MTFRDTSAETTLDGANMNEKFGQLIKIANPGADLTTTDDGEYMTPGIQRKFMGYQMRQPEIDALKDSLHRAINDARNFCQIGLNNWSEIQRLKAENERLRADAERYRWLKYYAARVDGDDFSWRSNVDSSVADTTLDTVIGAAMKDFSTTQKEEECDS